jgi:hypothetical protein
MSETHEYKLSDRPKWWLPRLFKWLAVIFGTLAIISYLSSLWIYWMLDNVISVTDETGEDSSENFAGLLTDGSATLVDVLFYVVFFWLLAIAIDKLDELVWLNAKDEDRSEIIQKRKKKKKS